MNLNLSGQNWFDYKEHKLDENVWLSTMYNIREMWVPTYFRAIYYIGGLFRSTSRSESENSFF